MNWKKIVLLTGVFLLSVFGSYHLSDLLFAQDKPSNLNNGDVYTPSNTYETGKELIMVFISSPNCGFCTLQEMPDLIEKSKLKSERIAKKHKYNFAVIGVSIEWSPFEGFKHFEKFGKFDEIMAGRNWFNEGALKYMHMDIPDDSPKASVPEIVLVSRDVFIKRGQEENIYKVTNETEVARISGVDQIKEFALEKEELDYSFE